MECPWNINGKFCYILWILKQFAMENHRIFLSLVGHRAISSYWLSFSIANYRRLPGMADVQLMDHLLGGNPGWKFFLINFLLWLNMILCHITHTHIYNHIYIIDLKWYFIILYNTISYKMHNIYIHIYICTIMLAHPTESKISANNTSDISCASQYCCIAACTCVRVLGLCAMAFGAPNG